MALQLFAAIYAHTLSKKFLCAVALTMTSLAASIGKSYGLNGVDEKVDEKHIYIDKRIHFVYTGIEGISIVYTLEVGKWNRKFCKRIMYTQYKQT